MAYSDKNIVITPNVSSSTADPKIVFSGADNTTSAQNITLQVYPTDNGTLSFEGSAGQLFTITNNMTGTIYSVNDVSGIPSIEVLDTGLIKLGQFSGNVLLGTGTDNGTDKLQVAGSVSVSGQIKSTLASGTAPLTVTSTTVVSNLNADLLDGNHSSAFATSGHNHTYNVNDPWLRDNGDNATVKLYGNSRQMVFRTDGTTEYTAGIGPYPFAFMYGGDAVSQRMVLISAGGDIWSAATGNWLTTSLNAKANVSHTHTTSDITGFVSKSLIFGR